MNKNTPQNQPPTTDDSSLSPHEVVLASFVAEVEAADPDTVDLDRWIEQHPNLADDFRGILRAITNLDRSRPADEPLRPQRLGEFRILQKLAQGGMGEVYLAEQERLKRLVAIKTIRQGRVSPENRRRFLREQEVLASLHQTHIVPIHTAGSEGDLQYFVMPYIKGATLQQVLRMAGNLAHADPQSPTPALGRLAAHALSSSTLKAAEDSTHSISLPTEAMKEDPAWSDEWVTINSSISGTFLPTTTYFRSLAQVLADVADAIEHAHGAGILHRDIKPSNIMVDENEQSWVIDFGLASHCDAVVAEAELPRSPHADSLTQTGRFVGTPAYMAPEQFGGTADSRTDVWGLGVTLYEMLTARRAFAGDDFTTVGPQVQGAQVCPPRSIVRTVPQDLEAICLKALEKDPDSRYQSLQAMAEDLRRWLKTEPIMARRPSILRRTAMWMQRHRAATAATVIVLVTALLLAAGVAWTSYQRRLELERNVGELIAQARAFLMAKDFTTAYQQLAIADSRLKQAGWQEGPLTQAVAGLSTEALAKMHAENTYQEFQRLRRKANGSIRHHSDSKAKAAANDARDALNQYGVLTDLDWKQGSDFQNLDADRQVIVEEAAAELLFHYCSTRLRGEDNDEATRLTRRENIDLLRRIETFYKPIPAIYLSISQTWELLGEEQLAQEAAQRAESLTPTTALDFYVMAIYLKRLDRTDEVLQNLSLALQCDPRNFLCMSYAGSALLSLGRYEPAEAMLTGALAIQPDSPTALYLRGICSTHLGKFNLALADFSRIAKLDPDDPLAYYAEGVLRFDQGEFARALALFEESVARDRTSYNSVLGCAEARSRLGEYGAAIQDYSRGIQLVEAKRRIDPVSKYWRKILAGAYLSRGIIHTKLSEPGAALEDFNSALAVLPDFVRAYHCRAQLVHVPAGNYESAIIDISQAIEIEPENVDHYRHRAAIYDQLKMTDQARADRRAVFNIQRRRAPETAQEQNDIAWQLVADPDPQLQDPIQAVKLATKAVTQVPTKGTYWNTLGVAQYRAGNWASAIDALEKSMSLSQGGDGCDWFFLAMACWQNGHPDEAHEWYDKARMWTDEHAADNRELAGFRVEAEALLDITSKSALNAEEHVKAGLPDQ